MNKKFFIFGLLLFLILNFTGLNYLKNKIISVKRQLSFLDKKIQEINAEGKISKFMYEQKADNLQIGKFIRVDDKYLKAEYLNLEKLEFNKPSAYIDYLNEKILIIRGNGKIYLLDNNKLNEVNSNIEDFIGNRAIVPEGLEMYLDNPFYRNAVRDLKVIDGTIYVVMNFQFQKESKFTTIILSGYFEENNINFEVFFNPNEYTIDKFDAAHSGGKIQKINDQFFLAVPDYGDAKNFPQNMDSIFGKIVKIIDKNNYEIITLGHRNPQGFLYIEENKKLFATEHGPSGGDEINLIEKNENYGWPISSYGEDKWVKNKKHSDLGHKDPLIYWNDNPGISEIAYVPNKSKLPFSDRLVVASLSGSIRGPEEFSGYHLYIYEFKDNKLIFEDKVFINDRIRDILYDEKLDRLILSVENSQSILFLSNYFIN
jgi:hypothetical protein